MRTSKLSLKSLRWTNKDGNAGRRHTVADNGARSEDLLGRRRPTRDHPPPGEGERTKAEILIRKILTHSSIPPTRFKMSLLVRLPESSGGRVRSFPSWHHHHDIHRHDSPRSQSPRGWTIGPLMAAVLKRLTPSTWSIKSMINVTFKARFMIS
jgi:hypothetical protein